MKVNEKIPDHNFYSLTIIPKGNILAIIPKNTGINPLPSQEIQVLCSFSTKHSKKECQNDN